MIGFDLVVCVYDGVLVGVSVVVGLGKFVYLVGMLGVVVVYYSDVVGWYFFDDVVFVGDDDVVGVDCCV